MSIDDVLGAAVPPGPPVLAYLDRGTLETPVVRDVRTSSWLELTTLNHVHDLDGTCYKNRFAVRCDPPLDAPRWDFQLDQNGGLTIESAVVQAIDAVSATSVHYDARTSAIAKLLVAAVEAQIEAAVVTWDGFQHGADFVRGQAFLDHLRGQGVLR